MLKLAHQMGGTSDLWGSASTMAVYNTGAGGLTGKEFEEEEVVNPRDLLQSHAPLQEGAFEADIRSLAGEVFLRAARTYDPSRGASCLRTWFTSAPANQSYPSSASNLLDFAARTSPLSLWLGE
jgi:hypothetical protein